LLASNSLQTQALIQIERKYSDALSFEDINGFLVQEKPLPETLLPETLLPLKSLESECKSKANWKVENLTLNAFIHTDGAALGVTKSQAP